MKIPGDQHLAMVVASNTDVTATAGDHLVLLTGSNDIVTMTGGAEDISVTGNANSITTGSADDRFLFVGSGETLDAGGGANRLIDLGSNNTLVLDPAGTLDIVRLGAGDTFDLRPALALSDWNGDPATLGQYLGVSHVGDAAVITASQTAGGSSQELARIEHAAGFGMSDLLVQAVV